MSVAVELTPADIADRWNALLDSHPWLDGLESTCGDVACCPNYPDGFDWNVLRQACGLLFLATGHTAPAAITRDMVPSRVGQ